MGRLGIMFLLPGIPGRVASNTGVDEKGTLQIGGRHRVFGCHIVAANSRVADVAQPTHLPSLRIRSGAGSRHDPIPSNSFYPV